MPGFILSGASLASPGPSTTPAVNTRSRLEGLPLSADLQPALSAEVADPLWLLCRQWQFVEFAGEDAGTPIDVRVEGERAELSRYLAGSLDAGSATRARDYLRRRPRARDGGRGRAGPRPSRPAGRRGRGPAAVDAQRRPAQRPVRGGLPLRPRSPQTRRTARRRVAGPGAAPRSIDARALFAALTPLRDATGALTGLPPEPVVPAELQDRGPRAARSLGALVRTALVDPSVAEAWNPARLEYAFAVSARPLPARSRWPPTSTPTASSTGTRCRRPGSLGAASRPATTGHAYRPAASLPDAGRVSRACPPTGSGSSRTPRVELRRDGRRADRPDPACSSWSSPGLRQRLVRRAAAPPGRLAVPGDVVHGPGHLRRDEHADAGRGT